MIEFEDFEKVDMRLGKIIEVQDFPKAKKPAYQLKIDFGDELRIKKSSAQLVGTHTKEELLGMLVVCVVNFPPRNIGGFESEVLTLGFKNTENQGYVLITPSKQKVELGSKLC
jgi:tRNA-binding protein